MNRKASYYSKAQSAMEFSLREKAGVCAKAQSAMEFLMTYGWAILIMLVVIAVLFYLGVLNPANVAPNSLTLPAGLSAYDYAVNSNGNLILDLGNGMGSGIYVTGIACADYDVSSSQRTDLNTFILPGDHYKVANGDIPCYGTESGEPYKGEVYIWYRIEDSLIEQKAVGDISYKVPEGGQPPPTATQAPFTPWNTPTTPPITPGETPGETPSTSPTSIPGATPISMCGSSISQSGLYVLEEDLTGCTGSGSAIEVTSGSQVVIDCLGNSILGTADVGINVSNTDNVVVRNCVISGFGTGISYRDSDNGEISGNTVSFSANDGILLDCSVNNNLTGNTVTDNMGYDIACHMSVPNIDGGGNSCDNVRNECFAWLNSCGGMVIDSCGEVITSPGLYVLENDLTGCTGSLAGADGEGLSFAEGTWAIKFDHGSDNAILDCQGHTISGTATVGVRAVGVSEAQINQITIQNCKISGFNNGIDMSGAVNSLASGNTVTGFQNYGIRIGGYGQSSPTNNVLDSNSITSSGANTGIFVMPESAGNSITGNTVAGSTVGIQLEGSSDNTVTGNTVAGNSMGLLLRGMPLIGDGGACTGNTITDNTITSNDHGIEEEYVGSFLEDNTFTGNTVTGNTGSDFYCDDEYSSDNVDGGGNDCGSNQNCGWLMSCPRHVIPNTCGQTIMESGYYVLESDLGPCEYSGGAIIYALKMGSANAVLDCQGHTISCAQQDLLGVQLMGGTITVKNCTVTNCDEGVSSYQTQSSLEDNTITNNNRGVVVDGAESVLTGNSITSNDKYGVYLHDYASYNNLTGNTITGNGEYGVVLNLDCVGNRFDGNTVTGNTDYDFACKTGENVDGGNTCGKKMSHCSWLTTCGTVPP